MAVERIDGDEFCLMLGVGGGVLDVNGCAADGDGGDIKGEFGDGDEAGTDGRDDGGIVVSRYYNEILRGKSGGEERAGFKRLKCRGRGGRGLCEEAFKCAEERGEGFVELDERELHGQGSRKKMSE